VTDRVELKAPCKVNLLLRVLAREESGFHQLETIFALTTLHDTLVASRREATGVSIEVHGADVGPHKDNLALRAAELVLTATGHPFGVHLELTKAVPAGAGLGGGSSNAASALHATNQLANNAIPPHELLQLAARLGSDVPFFLSGAPLALAWGRGDRLLRLPALPPAPGLLLHPAAPVATAEAYSWLVTAREHAPRRGALALDLQALASWGDLARMSGNDFESAVFGQRPDLRQAFEALAGTRPMLCRLSGTGASLIALYRTAGQRDDAAMMLGPKHGSWSSVEVGTASD
jgi:4-diphosphocytidyl-2-C-methyl-D-erythritol kinase